MLSLLVLTSLLASEPPRSATETRTITETQIQELRRYSSEIVAGFTPDEQWFGFCLRSCEHRLRRGEVARFRCLAGQVVGGSVVELKPLSTADFAKRGFVEVTHSRSHVAVDGIRYAGHDRFDDDARVCRNSLRASSKTVPTATIFEQVRKERCGNNLMFAIASPSGKQLAAVWRTDSGERGSCWDWTGFVFERKPMHASGLTATGLRHHRKRRFKKAINYYSRALELDPSHHKARYNLACAYGRLKDAARAAAEVKQLLTTDRTRWLPVIEKDEDFKSVRDTPAFKAALAP